MSAHSWLPALAVPAGPADGRVLGVGTGGYQGRISCVDDSAECVGQRQTALNALLAAQDRSWVKEPATPQAHASGVRLFACARARAS